MNLNAVIKLMQISLGLIFLWYGMLKLFDGVSPAQELATATISILSLKLLSPEISIKIIAIWEIVVGIGFILGVWLRVVFTLFFVHMIGTFTPLFILTDVTFTQTPYILTMVGQYIMKNIVFVLAGLSIYYYEKEKNSEKIYN